MSILGKLKSSLLAVVEGLGHAVLDAFDAALHEVALHGGEVLTAAAQAAVAAAEMKGGSGAEKFQAARAAVVQTLTTQGIPLAENAIQLAILAAVSEIRAKPQAQAGDEAAQAAGA